MKGCALIAANLFLMEGACEIAKFAGAFRDGRYLSTTRIDSIQHCLSALMQLATMGQP